MRSGTTQHVCETALDRFSASCFYFAQELSDMMGAKAPPIGLVHTAWGGQSLSHRTHPFSSSHTPPTMRRTFIVACSLGLTPGPQARNT